MNNDVIRSGDPAHGRFRLDNYVFYLIAQVDHLYNGQMGQVLQSIQVTRPRWRVLMCLREKSPRAVGDLAAVTTMELSTISRVVDKLRQEGLVSCAPRASDNRVTEVQLEDAGREALTHIVQVASKQYRRAVAGLSTAELQAFLNALRHIRSNLQRSPLE